MPKKSCSISVINLRFVKFQLNKGKWSKMILQYKISLFAVKLFEDHGINVDRAEILSLSIFMSGTNKLKATHSASHKHLQPFETLGCSVYPQV